MAQHRYLKVVDVADRFDVTPQTVRAWIRQGDMAAIRVGGTLRIPMAEVARIEFESTA